MLEISMNTTSRGYELFAPYSRGLKGFLKGVRSLRVNIDRALIFGYDLHEQMTVLTRHLMGGGCPEVNISDLVYTYYR